MRCAQFCEALKYDEYHFPRIKCVDQHILDTLDIRYLPSDKSKCIRSGFSWLIGYQNYNFIIKCYSGPGPDKGWTSHRVGTAVAGVVCTLWPSNMVTLYPCAPTITLHLNTATTEASPTIGTYLVSRFLFYILRQSNHFWPFRFFVKLREREGQRVDLGRSLKGHL